MDELEGDVLDPSDVEKDGTGPVAQSGDVIDSFGTLSISEHGVARFFGPTGGSEVRRGE